MSTVKGTTLNAKVVFLGDTDIGAKTSLSQRFVLGRCDESPAPTIGANFLQKRLIVDGVRVELELWGLRSHKKEDTYSVVNAYVHRHGRI